MDLPSRQRQVLHRVDAEHELGDPTVNVRMAASATAVFRGVRRGKLPSSSCLLLLIVMDLNRPPAVDCRSMAMGTTN